MELKPVPLRESLVKSVTDQMTRLIMSGSAPPGSRLPTEGALALQLGVSRTVIREALAQLKADGIVHSHRGRGLFVSVDALVPTVLRFRRPDMCAREIVGALLEMREGLEAQSARLAAARRNDEDLADLRQMLESMDRAEAEERDGVEEDFEFHRTVGRVSRNTYINQVIEFLAVSLRRSIAESRAIDTTRTEYLHAVRGEHNRIFEAIAAGDVDAAGEAMRKHTEAGQARLLQQQNQAAKERPIAIVARIPFGARGQVGGFP